MPALDAHVAMKPNLVLHVHWPDKNVHPPFDMSCFYTEKYQAKIVLANFDSVKYFVSDDSKMWKVVLCYMVAESHE